MIAVIYMCSDKSDIRVTKEILTSEGIQYTLVVDRAVATKLSNGKVNPSIGWCVYFPETNIVASSWKDIYMKLADRGLLRAI